ncbi:MAG: exodeoxyribonuclease III [Burkholderiales bacterium]|jgi:exodeoxyribonuclease-3|nr:exodeoxyribonuclease III [Burkholderiales bacterium]
MMRIITLNTNGIRSAEKKGVAKWLNTLPLWDVLCIQELKAQRDEIPETLKEPRLANIAQSAFFPAQKKGYSGVSVAASQPFRATCGLGVPEFDAEGRYLQADFNNLTVVSLYVPSGSSGEERQAAKYRFLDVFLPHLKRLAQEKEHLIICGDINIAHHEIDLKNWRSNQKNSGFLPEERAWLTTMLQETKLVDVFRQLDKRAEQYTWWSNRGQAWAKNVGWRLDYQFASPKIAATARAATIYKDERFSDHAPLIIDYDYSLL